MSNTNTRADIAWQKDRLTEAVRNYMSEGGSQHPINAIMTLLNRYTFVCSQLKSVADEFGLKDNTDAVMSLPTIEELNEIIYPVSLLTDFLLSIESIDRAIHRP